MTRGVRVFRALFPGITAEQLTIARDFSWYSIANILSLFLLLGTALAVRRYLGPYYAGIWTALELIPLYATYAHLGTLSAAERDLPYLAGARRSDELRVLKWTMFWFSHGLGACVGALIVAAAFVLRGTLFREATVGLAVYGGLVYVQIVSTCYVVLFRSEKRFVALSSRQAAANLVKALATVAGGYVAGLYGVLAGLALAGSAQLLLFHAAVGEPVERRFERRLIAPLIAQGLPILLGGVAFDILRTADRLTIGAALGAEALGVYSVAALAAQGLFYLPNALTIVLNPRLQERFGANDDPRAMRGLFETPLAIASDAVACPAAAAVLALPIAVHVWLPQFSSAVAPAVVLMTGTYFLSLSSFAGQILVTLRRQALLFSVSGVAMGIGLLTAWLLSGRGLTAVAFGCSAVFGVYFLVLTLLALHCLRAPAPAIRVLRLTSAGSLVTLLSGALGYWRGSDGPFSMTAFAVLVLAAVAGLRTIWRLRRLGLY